MAPRMHYRYLSCQNEFQPSSLVQHRIIISSLANSHERVGFGRSRFRALSIRVTAPRVKIKVRSWKLELLANISEGRKTPPQQEFCVIAYRIPCFSSALPGHGCQGLGLLTSNFDLCTGAPWLYSVLKFRISSQENVVSIVWISAGLAEPTISTHAGVAGDWDFTVADFLVSTRANLYGLFA